MRIAFIICFSFIYIVSRAQFTDESRGTIRAIGMYTSDFPGLNGYTIGGEYIRSIAERIEAGGILTVINLKGYPRTSTVQEFTKAKTMGLSVYFLPILSPNHKIRLGAGYQFSFYNTRRTYPLVHGSDKQWPVVERTGRTSGMTLAAEYEYRITESPFSFGIRLSAGKAYDGVGSIGSFIGLDF